MKLTGLLPKQRRALAGVALVAALTIPLSAGPSAAVQVCNTTPIVFTPPAQPTFAVQPLNPYPSQITVSGFEGTITDVNVLLNDITYAFPEDLDVLVVHPDGTSVLLMSDVGGDNNAQNSTQDVDLVLDQQAPNPLPADTQLVSGTFRPLDDDDDMGSAFPVDTFPAPGPGTTIGGTDLNVFNGKTANGTWSLYVVDDEPGPPSVQDIGGGWCLDILTSGTPTSSSTPTTGNPTSSTQPTTSTTQATTSTTQATTSTTQATTSTTQATTSTTQATTSTTQVTTTTTTVPTTTSSSTTSTSSTTTSTTPGSCGGLTPTIVGTGAGETINGTPGPDVIAGGGGADTINGLGGDDTICGGEGNDTINGGEGNDRLFGDNGNDRLMGGNGNDTLNGGALLDQCFGDAGTDTAAACEQVFTTP